MIRPSPSLRPALVALIAALVLVGCAPMPVPQPTAPAPVVMRPAPDPVMPPAVAAQSFVQVVARVQPVAEQVCRERGAGRRCDFLIRVDDRPGVPINAYQTVAPDGRPLIVFTGALIRDARNADELAFVLGHEAAHHIAGHIPRTRDTALAGAIVAGTLAAMGGADPGTIRTAQNLGAAVGARTYSREFELEADALGTVIAYRAGFDPERGIGFFNRLPDPGNRFLGTHPPNAARVEIVRRTLARLRAGAPA
ncbi:MAG: M48 family metalloprotease [Gemmobacter sp.]